jgi:hypothetical protein
MSLPHKSGPYTPGWLRIGFWVCFVISVAVVIRRLVALAVPPRSSPPQMAGLDQVFASHAALTLAHILPALAFILIVPFSLLRRFSRLTWPEQLIFPLGVIVGLTAYAMSAFSIGGWTERSAVFFYDTLFLLSIGRAWLYGRNGLSVQKRKWLLRSVAVLLGIATTRPVMALLFATSSLTHLGPRQFFGIAFWIGFSINWVIVEIWLHQQRAFV